jgi:predicted transcriptional regulator YheO
LLNKSLFQVLIQQADALKELFHPFCEIVIHDFSDLEHSIIYITGDLTGRSVHGPPTDLLLSRAQKGDTDKDLLSYVTGLSDGRLMKSSTVFLRDEKGIAFGAFCINFDISPFITFNKQLSEFVMMEGPNEVTEVFSADIYETIQGMVMDALNEMQASIQNLSRNDKIELISRLYSRGAFQVKKAVPIVADLLGLSRATVYNYIREVTRECLTTN